MTQSSLQPVTCEGPYFARLWKILTLSKGYTKTGYLSPCTFFIEVPECQENEGPYISVNHNSYYSVTYIYGSQSN
jgi:hypothetical protein